MIILPLVLWDEITDYLNKFEIVALFGVNKAFNKLWDTRLAEKIFWNWDEAWKLSRKEKWVLDLINMMQALPQPKRIGSFNRVFVLKVSYGLIVELLLLINQRIIIWKPFINVIEKVDLHELEEESCAIHLVSFENNRLAILYTNNLIKLVQDYQITAEFRLEIAYFNVSKMFYLSGGSFLVFLTTQSEVIYMNNNGDIVSNRKLGYIYECHTVPWHQSSFLAIINSNIWLISLYSEEIVCKFKSKKKDPRILVDKTNQKILIINQFNINACKKLVDDDSIVVVTNPKDKKIILDANTQLARCGDKSNKKRYQIPIKYENIFYDHKLLIVNAKNKPDSTNNIYFFYWNEETPFFIYKIKNLVSVIGYSFPYLLYSIITDSGIQEIHVIKLYSS